MMNIKQIKAQTESSVNYTSFAKVPVIANSSRKGILFRYLG